MKMLGNSQSMSNGLVASIDWLSFTIHMISEVDDVISFLGYTSSDFVAMPKGASGYKSMLKLSSCPLFILFDGNEDMGIHVDCSGSAISDLVSHFKNTLMQFTPFGVGYTVQDFSNTYTIELLKAVRSVGAITRFDLAIDDFGGQFYSVRDVLKCLKDQSVISKFRTYRDVFESSITGECTGHTLYLGSRSSDIMLRIYDKKLEQNKKLSATGQPLIEEDWVRWELELKGDRADMACDCLIGMQDLGMVIAEILNNYMRIINNDDSNRSRCSVSEKWLEFVGTVKRLRLYVPSEGKTLENKKRWLVRSVMPTLCGVILSEGGGIDFIANNFDDGVARMSKELQHIVKRSNPDGYAMYCDSFLKG